MKRILIAVDETIGTKNVFLKCGNFCSCMRPDFIALVYVEKFEGKSLIAEMLGDAEMSTLKNVLMGSAYQDALDKKARTVLDHYQKALEDRGLTGVKTIIRKGHPAEEILKTAGEENVDMIIVGARGKRTSHLFMGSVSREVADTANVPVLIMKQS